MPGLHRDSHKHGANKQRVLLDGSGYEPAQTQKPRAFQQPTVSPAPFVVRHVPEAPLSKDLPLWPGWHDDPTGRHESRYFDGSSWTDNVVDGARSQKDPYEPAGSQLDPKTLVDFEVSHDGAPNGDTNGHGLANGNGHSNGNGNGHEPHDDRVDAGVLIFGKVPLED
jgi:hypothetical protein